MNSKTIIVSPYAKLLRNGQENPKNYPFWDELISFLVTKNYDVLQVGLNHEKPIKNTQFLQTTLPELIKYIQSCYIWVSVDNAIPHIASFYKKQGIVLWGKSDPVIFGDTQNINLIKSRVNLRHNQFDVWENETYDPNVFMSANTVINILENMKVI